MFALSRFPRILGLVCLLFIVGGKVAFGEERKSNRAQRSDLAGWSQAFAHQKQELAEEPADLCFVGDSLTEFWTATGKAIWELEFHAYRAVNFGIAADRTENILYRIERGELAANPPRVFVVLGGTNNLAMEPADSPEETVVGIVAILDALQKDCPESKIFCLTLPPNGFDPESPLRERVVKTNRLLRELELPEQMELIDIYPVFADESGRWRKGMTLDGTHFSQTGYDHLARSLKPVIQFLED